MDKLKKPKATDVITAVVVGVILQSILFSFWIFDFIPERQFISLIGSIVWVMVLNCFNLGLFTLKARHFVLLFLGYALWQLVCDAYIF
ncbi:Uncharacterized protein AC499_0755 [Pseudomonas amygdali pv. lachrymans]|uniref:Nicotinamide riboside transporter PnuC n=1 Tax=Pseudomonas amygdali pv. lachrymans TaxID=53707 RepID=A0ABR5KRX9_PSEAV|nr:Uncharacterized protein AC499_0755 [Pseudomonas amygdali pv. lachrymans]